MDDGERQLKWIQRNRTRKEARLIGTVAAEVLAQQVQSGPAWRRRLLAILAEHVGPEFLDRVIVAGLCDGVLRLEVTEPGELYALRVEWEQRLEHIVRAELPAAGIQAVRFALRGHKN